MRDTSAKKGFRFFVILLSAVLALAAGIYFIAIHGTFGLDNTHNGMCYDPLIPIPPSRRAPPCAYSCISAIGT